ncbi:methyltransferase domain-containing protein [Lasiosphaeria miniovina]|uniref:Methyltransferase domain-containing protein n=1 Tax=Lasiosphaeria miniovina TaxID=1954250 RepID=A0AA40B5F6_9PEZI|nr:methyltransferase domain-containing protein [Lasiosphaeria miniovina]KAK0727992.1 methyltransferase domain-containing protein [Lasiosphaeria miniovina]
MAIETTTANGQHYEVPTPIMAAVLGSLMKYSGCLFLNDKEMLAQAEVNMLQSYVDKADIKMINYIPMPSCGWGSATLFLARRLPDATIIGFSNSKTQKEHIVAKAKEQGLGNVRVITGDVIDYEFEHESFDRILSVSHVKNYELLMVKTARALRPCGHFFVDVFGHRDTPYHFQEDWMSTHFLTGGTMPSQDLLPYFQEDLTVQTQWWVDGHHYRITAEHWVLNWKANKYKVWPHLVGAYREENASAWFNRWLGYYLAISEMFEYGEGKTYGVIHLFTKRRNSPPQVRE